MVLSEAFAVVSTGAEGVFCCFDRLITVEEGARVVFVLTPENVEAAVDNLSCRNPGLVTFSFREDDDEGKVVESDFDISF